MTIHLAWTQEAMNSNGSYDFLPPGPTSDHTWGNSTGHYFYTEVSGVASGAKARIMSPTYSQTSRVCKLQFYYWMEGSGIGES